MFWFLFQLINFAISYEQEDHLHLSKCAPIPPSNDYDVIISSQINTKFTNKLIYGCQQEFKSISFKLDNCILLIYSSNFTNAISHDNALYFNLDAASSQLLGNIEINNCRFLNYHSKIGGAIYISTKDTTRTIAISNSFFLSSMIQRSEKGGAMFINAISVTIENTQFIDCNSEYGGAIYYTNPDINHISLNNLYQSPIRIQRCTFNNSNAIMNGGSIYFSIEKLKSSRPIEVINCAFHSCSTQEGNGGGIFIKSFNSKSLFKIIECKFGQCFSSSKGGAIYFDALSGSIKRCTFSNNEARNGDDLYYAYDSDEIVNGEKLIITANKFCKKNSNHKEGSVASLIFTSLCPSSKLVFTHNHIKFEEPTPNLFVFDYPNDAKLVKGQIKLEYNKISPSDETIIESKKLINTHVNVHSAFNFVSGANLVEYNGAEILAQECPEKPTNPQYEDLPDTNENAYTADKRKLYACGKTLAYQMQLSKCSLLIYFCNFNDYTTGVFELSDDGKGTNANTILISGSNFYNCQKTAITISSTASVARFEIIDCRFEMTAAIAFDASNVNIVGCQFINCKSSDSGAHDIVCKTESASKTVTIKNNTFRRTSGEYKDAGTFVHFTYFKDSKLEFNYNKFFISGEPWDNIRLFSCEASYENFNNWDFSSNYIHPYDLEAVLKGENAANLPFVEFDPVYECEDLPDTIQRYYSQCGSIFQTSGEHASDVVVLVHHCVFINMKNDGICSLYISITKQLDDQDESIQIYNCEFYNINGGHAIYINTVENTRLYDIQNCTFKNINNDFTFADNNSPKGGAIYIASKSCNMQIIGCLFDTNHAASGGAICTDFGTPEEVTNTNKYSLLITECTFKNNKAYSNGAAICISMPSGAPQIPIEIKQCSFELNSVTTQTANEGFGGDIYYSLTPSKTPDNFNFNIISCNFSNSQALTSGGSIYLNIDSTNFKKGVEIIDCNFYNCLSENGAVYFDTKSPLSLFHVDGCVFDGIKQISFNAIYGIIENCDFINTAAAITYVCSSQTGTGSLGKFFKINNCTFTTPETPESSNINHIIFLTQTAAVNFYFEDNEINITNDQMHLFDAEPYDSSIKATWVFKTNSIIPARERFIKTERAKDWPPSCKNGFWCEITPSFGFTESNPFSYTEGFSKSLVFSKSGAFSKTAVFSQSNKFSNTKGFSQSKQFSRSEMFTKTDYFSHTGDFSKSTVFSQSSMFSLSKPFDETGHFTQSMQFSSSSQFSETGQFTKTGVFSYTKDFSKSELFSQSSMFSQSNQFSGTKQFSQSKQFSLSKQFSETGQFTKTDLFSQSKDFSVSSAFSQSVKFSGTGHFSHSGHFSLTNDFSRSTKFTESAEFSQTGQFSKSVQFSKSSEFSVSSMFSQSDKFSGTKQFSKTDQFSSSGEFSKTLMFSSSSEFSVSEKFSQSKAFSSTNEFSKTMMFSSSAEFSQTGQFSVSKQFSKSSEFSTSFFFSQSDQFSKTGHFSRSKEFSLTSRFSMSTKFTLSGQFSTSNEFSLSSPFSQTSGFSTSMMFSSSGLFSSTGDFSMSTKFTLSGQFSKSNEFSLSSPFSQTSGFSTSMMFSSSNAFSETVKFTNSERFSYTNDFTLSSQFSNSKSFSKSKGFSQSDEFSKTTKFSHSISFTESIKFTESQEYSLSLLFSKSHQFSDTRKFTETDPFSVTKGFTKSSEFSETDKFSKSTLFTKSSHFTDTEKFTFTGHFSHSTKFTFSNNFSPSRDFSNSNGFSYSNQFSESYQFSPSVTLVPLIPACSVVDDKSNITMSDRCDYSAPNGTKVVVQILATNFTDYTKDEDGGAAIRVINCEFNCNGTKFINCVSNRGAGGAVYIKNNFDDIQNNITFIDTFFIQCSAVYGGAVYIYNSHEENYVLFLNCTFDNNIATGTKNNENHRYGGSSIYLTSKNVNIKDSRFNKGRGKGGSVKIYDRFNEEEDENDGGQKMLEIEENSVSISGCSFDQDKDSIVYLNDNKFTVTNVEVIDCDFKGKLVDGAHYIDGELKDKKNPRFHIQACKFDYDLNVSVNAELIKESNDIEIRKPQPKSLTSIPQLLLKKLFTLALWAGLFILVIVGLMKLKNCHDQNNNYSDDNFDQGLECKESL